MRVGGNRQARDDDALMSTDDAAAYCNRRAQTLRKWRWRGGGPPYYRLGNSLQAPCGYRRSELDAWLAARRYSDTTQEGASRPAAMVGQRETAAAPPDEEA
ncbi:MAG: helix-turn-helix transcriptional regulator [Acidobacteriota bacterium]